MSDLREPLDAPPPSGPADVARVKELSAVAEAKAFDPTAPPYNPTDLVSPRREPPPPTPGLDSPVLLDLSTRVHTASAARFHPRVGGDGPASTRPDGSVAAVEAVEVPENDAFGPIDADLYRAVPCVEQRPRRVYELDGSDAPLTEAEAEAIVEAKARVVEVLSSARENLTADDVQEALQHVNPLDERFNCVECAKAVDDILAGRAAAAGPTEDQRPYYVEAALTPRAVDYLDNVSPAEIERLVREAGPGARGIVVGWDGSPVHAYNIANLQGDVYWLDGQRDLMTEHNPHRFASFELYLTASEGEE